MAEKFILVRPFYGINIHTDAQGEFGTVLHSNDVFPDLPLITAATILEQAEDYEVEVIEAVVGKMLPDELLSKIYISSFDTAIVKTTAASFKSDLEVAHRIKKNAPGCTVMVAGQAVRVMKDWIYDNTDVDVVIDEPLDLYIYRYVYGADADMNDLPCPDYTLVDYRQYIDDYNNVRLTLQASRGCLMGCRFCPYVRYYDHYEERDAAKVFEDFKTLASLGADVIQFRDQFFTCNRNRIKEFCRMVIESGIKVRWICETKLDSLDRETVDLMKEAGLFLICFGVESGDKKILDAYSSHKGSFDDQKGGIEYLRSLGILTMAFYVVGFPEDTWETIETTYRYADSLDSDIVAFNEYCDFDLSGIGSITPDVFASFENSILTGRPTNLTREEILYAVELFHTMYTLKREPLKRAYDYNHKLVLHNRSVASEISKYEKDLISMSREIRVVDSKRF